MASVVVPTVVGRHRLGARLSQADLPHDADQQLVDFVVEQRRDLHKFTVTFRRHPHAIYTQRQTRCMLETRNYSFAQMPLLLNQCFENETFYDGIHNCIVTIHDSDIAYDFTVYNNVT